MDQFSSSEESNEFENICEDLNATGTTTASVCNSSLITNSTNVNRSPGSATLSVRRSSNLSTSTSTTTDATVNTVSSRNTEAVEHTSSDSVLYGITENDNVISHNTTNGEDDIPHNDVEYNLAWNEGADNVPQNENVHNIQHEIENNSDSCSLSEIVDDYMSDISNTEYEDDSSERDENDENDDGVNYFQSLLKTLEKDDYNQTIDAFFVVNKIEILLAILKFSSVYSLPNSAVADLCKMVNSFLNKNIIPESRYKIDQLFYAEGGKQYHAVCPRCKTYTGQFQRTDQSIFCNVCEQNINLKDPSFRDFFVTLDVANEVRDCIESNEEYYNSVVLRREEENSNFNDFYDGQMYKDFVASLPDNKKDCYATAVFNSDGSPAFKSSKFSVWPIQLVINELPMQTRLQRPIVYALWFGHDKPDMTFFLRTFVNDMNAFSENGIACNFSNGEKKIIYVHPLCCCVDSVARAPMQGTTQFNGHYGCNWCYHPGVSVFHVKGNATKYPLLDDIPAIRTEDETFRHMLQSVQSGKPVFGVKTSSPLINLSNFNIIRGFVPDTMHCIDLGIAKQFAEYWLTSSHQEYTIPKNYISIIDEYILNFKVPTNLARLSRSIKDRKYWKAREWMNWVLYYSVPILAEIPNFRQYLEHWSLLVQAYHLLLQVSITEDALLQADNLLKRFVSLTEYYYGQDAMSFNIHQLCHLTQSVADWGPVWSHFGYPFECGNGRIIKDIHAAKGVLSQICRNLSFRQSINLLEKHVALKEYSPIRNYCHYLVDRCTQRSKKIGSNRYFGKCIKVNKIAFQELNLPRDRTTAYVRMTKNKCLFQTCNKFSYRSNNSFACLEDGTFIQIEQFLINEDNRKEYIVCRKIEVEAENLYNNLNSIQRIIQVRPELCVIETNALSRISVCMQLNLQRYIVAVPNMYCY